MNPSPPEITPTPYFNHTICITGHRPEKLEGHSNEAKKRVYLFADTIFSKYVREHPDHRFLIGGALGWDYSVAVSLPMSYYVIVKPFKGYRNKWNLEDVRKYNIVDKNAFKVEIVSDFNDYSPMKMHIRNQWMVDRSHEVIALWDGEENGGTYNCIKYAKKRGLPITNLWDQWQDYIKDNPLV